MLDIAFVLIVITALLVVVGLCQPLAVYLKLPPPVLLGVVGVALGGFPAVMSQLGWSSQTDVFADIFTELPVSSGTFIYVFLPLLVIPQLIATFGAAWLLASLGVFVRDIVQGITLFLMAWMYLTPIIYPEALVPERYRSLVNLNPFTALVRNYRRIILEGTLPDWQGLAYFSVFAIASFLFGYWWFARTRKNFADVI